MRDLSKELEQFMAHLAQGFGHYKGRGWRGFHHHTALSIAASGLLMAQRAQRHLVDLITTLRFELAVVLTIALGHCPYCSSIKLHLHL